MAEKVALRVADSEKFTINIGFGETLHIQVLGLAVIAPDVSADLARATIASIEVLGALQAGPEVKAALSDRIR
jgi:hypothetical protein